MSPLEPWRAALMLNPVVFFQVDQDLTGNSVDPIHFSRYYDRGNSNETFLGYQFGSRSPLLASDEQDSSKHSYALISERGGFLIPYRTALHSDHHDQRKTYRIDPRVIEKG